jgi:hypothetical protein
MQSTPGDMLLHVVCQVGVQYAALIQYQIGVLILLVTDHNLVLNHTTHL